MEESQEITKKQIEQFAILSNAVIGAKESFKAFGNIDSSGISTFRGQINDLFDVISKGDNATSKLAKLAASFGGSLSPELISILLIVIKKRIPIPRIIGT